MNNFDLYKEFYFKEIERKNQINNSYNLPILVITTIVTLNLFFLKQEYNCCISTIGKIIFVISVLCVIVAIIYLVKSFSNFHKTLVYRELPDMNRLKNYEDNLYSEQKKTKDATYLFNDFLRKEFAECTTHNFLINKTRTEDIAKAKIAIFVSVVSTFIFFLIYIFNFF